MLDEADGVQESVPRALIEGPATPWQADGDGDDDEKDGAKGNGKKLSKADAKKAAKAGAAAPAKTAAPAEPEAPTTTQTSVRTFHGLARYVESQQQ